MKALGLVLLGGTACTFQIDEGRRSSEVADAAPSEASSSEASSSVVTTSRSTSSGPGSLVTSSTSSTFSTAIDATGSSFGTVSASQSSATVSTGTRTESSVGSTAASHTTTDSQADSSQDTGDSVSDSGTPTEEPQEGDPEPGKLAGITERHNYYREMISMGEPLPLLQWDPEIAELAQEWAEVLAEDCSFEHSGRAGLGENLATFGASNENGLTRGGPDAVDMWYSEVECYSYGTIAGPNNMGTEECSAECDQYGGCGHYTQVVWRETLRVGCGIASCEREGFYWDTIVCNYDPPGNYIGQYPY